MAVFVVFEQFLDKICLNFGSVYFAAYGKLVLSLGLFQKQGFGFKRAGVDLPPLLRMSLLLVL